MTQSTPDGQVRAPRSGPSPVPARGIAGPNSEPADLIVDAVLTVPGVVEMHQGMYGEVASYLPGRKVPGVQIRDHECHVHVVMLYDVDIPATAHAVRTAVEPIVGTPVHVTIQDLVDESPRTDGRGRADQP